VNPHLQKEWAVMKDALLEKGFTHEYLEEFLLRFVDTSVGHLKECSVDDDLPLSLLVKRNPVVTLTFVGGDYEFARSIFRRHAYPMKVGAKAP
jgi:hypothetical protein